MHCRFLHNDILRLQQSSYNFKAHCHNCITLCNVKKHPVIRARVQFCVLYGSHNKYCLCSYTQFSIFLDLRHGLCCLWVSKGSFCRYTTQVIVSVQSDVSLKFVYTDQNHAMVQADYVLTLALAHPQKNVGHHDPSKS